MANAYLIASTFALMSISFGWGIAFKILWKEYRKQELREERTAKQEVEEKKTMEKTDIIKGLNFMRQLYQNCKRVGRTPIEEQKWQSECQHDPEKAFKWMLDSDIEILTAAIEYISRT